MQTLPLLLFVFGGGTFSSSCRLLSCLLSAEWVRGAFRTMVGVGLVPLCLEAYSLQMLLMTLVPRITMLQKERKLLHNQGRTTSQAMENVP